MPIALACICVSLLSFAPLSAASLRPCISLDGEWRLSVPAHRTTYMVKVPGTWQAQVPELRSYLGRATYTRQAVVPESWRGKLAFIHFGAVDYFAEVYVNGAKVGSHEGGYTPFEFEISKHLRLGKPNEIRLDVLDVGPDHSEGGFSFSEIPHGKQSWYGNASGPWQSVRLEARNPAHIERVVVDPDIDSSTVRLRVELSGVQTGTVRFSIQAPRGARAIRQTIERQAGTDEVGCEFSIPNAALWSPESPSLYTARAELVVDGNVVDAVYTPFGMRKIEAREGRIYLNNKPIFIAGALDQDFYPLTEYTVPSDDYLKDQFLKAKRLGLNLLRCHIKVPDPRYLDWADRLGLLVWYEIPNWKELTENSRRRGRETLEAMLRRDHNHPSLVIVSIINEAWGVNVNDESHRKWMADMYDHAKSLEPSRLVVDNSACGGNFHVKTDIEDYHVYLQIPDQAPLCRDWIKDFSGHPAWTFTSTPDKQRRGFEPLLLSEFGNWGLPRITGLEKVYGGDPWWFGERRSSNRSATSPAGVQDRFAEHRLDVVFGSLDGLADAYQNQQWLALKFQIEEMRKYPSIAGYVITEFADLHWESNGLLDYCRNPKTFHDLMHTVQDPDIVLAQPQRHNHVSGEMVKLDAWVSHFSSRELDRSMVEWRLDGTQLKGSLPIGALASGDARKTGEITFTAPDVSVPKRMRVNLRLLDSRRSMIAENYTEINVFPSRAPETPSGVIISSSLDKETVRKVKAGATAVICVETPGRLPLMRGGFQIVDRGVDGRWGAWCNSVTWFKGSPAFAGAPIPRTMDFSFENIIPSCVIEGIEPAYWADDVLSGIFVGWVQSHAAVVAQVRCGSGKAIFTTLPLVSGAEKDPMARFLLSSLANYAASDRCAPKLRNDLEVIELDHTLVPTAERGGARWRYTTKDPGPGWEQPSFDDSGWREGKSGFGTTGTPNSHVGTRWDTSDIWIRFEGEIPGKAAEAMLRLYHDEDAEVYLNGRRVLSVAGYIPDYENHFLGPDALAAFAEGRNVLAVHCRQTVGGQFVDLGLQYSLEETQ